MKLGRNDPCHCGSGKKYKICHYAVDAAKRSHAFQQAPVSVVASVGEQLEGIIQEAQDRLAYAITQHGLNESIKAKGYTQLASSFFGAMAHGAMQAIVELTRAGLQQQALVNYRCLVEFWTKAYFYSEYPDLAEMFISSLPTKRGQLSFLRGHRLKKPLRQKVEAEAQSAIALRPGLESWKEPSVEAMMTKLSAAMPAKDRQLAYFTSYRYASAYVHGEIIVLPNILISNDEGDRIVRLDNTRLSFGNHILKNAALVIMSVAHRIGETHGVNLTYEMKLLASRIDALGDMGEGPPSEFNGSADDDQSGGASP